MELLPRGDEDLVQTRPMPEKPVILPPLPSKTQQSYGAIISVILIMLMILVGAFYAWGKRISESAATTSMPPATDTAAAQQ